MTIETIRFANDTQTRKRLMVPDSFQHPAKGQLGRGTNLSAFVALTHANCICPKCGNKSKARSKCIIIEGKAPSITITGRSGHEPA